MVSSGKSVSSELEVPEETKKTRTGRYSWEDGNWKKLWNNSLFGSYGSDRTQFYW